MKLRLTAISLLWLALCSTLSASEWRAEVRIRAKDDRGVNYASGAVIDAREALVLTCWHLLRHNPSTILVDVYRTEGNGKKTWRAQRLAYNRQADLLLLRIPDQAVDSYWKLKPRHFQVELGMKASVYGCPEGRDPPVKIEGQVQDVNRYLGFDNLTFSKPFAMGVSGGPVVHAETGFVIGVVTATDRRAGIVSSGLWEVVSRCRQYKPALYYWQAKWCQTCRQFSRDYYSDKAFRESIRDKYRIVSIDYQRNKPWALLNGITGLPAFWPADRSRPIIGYTSREALARKLGLDYDPNAPQSSNRGWKPAPSNGDEQSTDPQENQAQTENAQTPELPERSADAPPGPERSPQPAGSDQRAPEAPPPPAETQPETKSRDDSKLDRIIDLLKSDAVKAAPGVSDAVSPSPWWSRLIAWLGSAAGLSALGATGVGLAIPVGIWLFRHLRRRREEKKSAKEPAAPGTQTTKETPEPGQEARGDKFPFPRHLDETRELLTLRQSEGRVAALDALRGMLLDDTLRRFLDSEDERERTAARRIRDQIDDQVDQIAPIQTPVSQSR